VQIARLKTGDSVYIWAEGGSERGAPEFAVEIVEKNRFWVEAESLGLKVGDRVLILRSIAGDARYRTACEVASLVASKVAFEELGEWQRVQARDSVRIVIPSTPIEAQLRDSKSDSFEMTMLDLSNGGLMAESAEKLECGDEIDCRFQLSESDDELNLRARVVRRSASSTHPKTRHCIAVEFLKMPDSVEASLTRWVFREEIRRNNLRRGTEL
jgi:Tfp pilus assembly protein PilZ